MPTNKSRRPILAAVAVLGIAATLLTLAPSNSNSYDYEQAQQNWLTQSDSSSTNLQLQRQNGQIKSSGKSTGGAAIDPAEAVSAGVSSVVSVVAFVKEPSVETAAGSLAAIGALVMLAVPAPAGLIVGGIMAISGGIMQLFAKKKPSDEMLKLREISKKLEEISAKIDDLQNSVDEVLRVVTENNYLLKYKGQIDHYKNVKSSYKMASQYFKQWVDLGKSDQDRLKNHFSERIYTFLTGIESRQHFMRGSEMWKLIAATQQQYGDYEAARLMQWVIAVRYEAYGLLIMAENFKFGYTTSRVAIRAQEFEADMKFLNAAADNFQPFRSKNPNNHNGVALPLFLWNQGHLKWCDATMKQYNMPKLMQRTDSQKGINCRVYDKNRNLVHYRFAFKITKADGVKLKLVYNTNDTGASTWLNVYMAEQPAAGKNCYSLGHFISHSAEPSNVEMYCPFEHTWMVSKPTGYAWVWSDHGTRGSMYTTFYIPKCRHWFQTMGFIASKHMRRPNEAVSGITDDKIVCINKSMATKTDLGSSAWTDSGSGGDYDARLYKIDKSPWTYAIRLGYNAPYEGWIPNYEKYGTLFMKP